MPLTLPIEVPSEYKFEFRWTDCAGEHSEVFDQRSYDQEMDFVRDVWAQVFCRIDEYEVSELAIMIADSAEDAAQAWLDN